MNKVIRLVLIGVMVACLSATKVCDDGGVGEDCKKQCNCHNVSCDHVTGECPHGCRAGYMEPTCQTPCEDGWFGRDCDERCNCFYSTCDKVTGRCELVSDCNCETGCTRNLLVKCDKCKVGWSGPYCQKKNVALNGTATQQGTSYKGRAHLAVDGNIDTDFNQGSCSHTDSRNNSWWSVQLGDNGVNQIKYMRIYNRNCINQNEDRRMEMEILLDGQPCKKWSESETPEIVENVTCNHTLTGHNLTITVPAHHLSLCEVQVFVCSDGWYGEDCESQCNCSCSNITCDKISGECECPAGYTEDDCQNLGLPPGCDGPDSSANCSHCANKQECNTTGRCASCEDGWKGNRCDEKSSLPGSLRCDAYNVTFENRTLQVPEAFVGNTSYTKEKCYKENPLGEMTCLEDRNGSAFWEPFRLNPACNSSLLAQSEVSREQADLTLDNITNIEISLSEVSREQADLTLDNITNIEISLSEVSREQADLTLDNITNIESSLSEVSRELADLTLDNITNIESVLEKTDNITTDRNLTEPDVLLMIDILENIGQLPEISPKLVKCVLSVCYNVLKFTNKIMCETGKENVNNSVFKIIDSVTAKMIPGSSGYAKVSTESCESEVWELRNKHVKKLPVGLTFVDKANTAFNTLFSPPAVHAAAYSSIALNQGFVQSLVTAEQGTSIRLSMNLFRNPPITGKCKRHQLISTVISITILVDGQAVTDLKGHEVTFTLKTTKAAANTKHVCGYWNFSSGSWCTDGCRHEGVEAGQDVCVCNHLTNFAVLLDLDGKSDESHALPLTLITMVGLTVSIAGLFVTAASHILFRKLLKSNPDKTLFHLSLSQLCAWTVFLTGFNQTQSYVGCVMVAALLHYFIMASFLWMLAEAVLYYIPLVRGHTAGSRSSRYMIFTTALAWGLPLLPVVTLLSIDVDLYRGRDDYCWMSWITSLYAFAAPVGVVVLCNLLLYGLTVFSICRRGDVGQKKPGHSANKMNIWASFVLFVLFGLSWVFGFLAVAEAKVIFQYIFCVTASTQGFMLFLLFTARNKKVRESWRNLCCRKTNKGSRPTDILKMELVSQRKDVGTAAASNMETKETVLHTINYTGP